MLAILKIIPALNNFTLLKLDKLPTKSSDVYINPIPSGLVLTGIVVSVSVSALMLSLTIRLYERYGTLDLDEISTILKKEGK